MKIVHCSTSVSHSSANYRIHRVLLEKGVNSKILVLNKNNDRLESVYQIGEYGLMTVVE